LKLLLKIIRMGRQMIWIGKVFKNHVELSCSPRNLKYINYKPI